MTAAQLSSAVESRLRSFDQADAARRLWERDSTLWTPEQPAPPELRDRLGWLETPRAMEARWREFAAFGVELLAEGVRDVVLLGMGGSSLFPDLLSKTFGPAAGAPALTVLDSTVPAAIAAVRRRLDPGRTFVLVASKSGSTVETASLYSYFRAELDAALGAKAGDRFGAITDPGTPFERQARAEAFRHAFLSPPDVGGRFSALTPFGLVPAGALGLAGERLLASAQAMAEACGPERPASLNPGFQLGAWLGEHALAGRDKLTLLLSPKIASLGAWLEQLVAESTGKRSRGILPIDGAGSPEAYGDDRVFVHVRLRGDADPALDKLAEELRRAGRPILAFELGEPWELGGEVFRWEVATAVAGMVLQINPFDQPNVQETKDLTKEILSRPPAPPAAAATARDASLLAAGSKPGDYFAINAFLAGTPEELAALAALRRRLETKYRRPATVGLGPRYLHSTGQLHKGGSAAGIFFVLTAEGGPEIPIPGLPFGFGRLADAQAEGDLQALLRRGRRAARLHLGARPAEALRELASRL